MTWTLDDMLAKISGFPFPHIPSVQNDGIATVVLVEVLEALGKRRTTPRWREEIAQQLEDVVKNDNIWHHLHHKNDYIAPIIPMCFVANRPDVLTLALSHLAAPDPDELLGWTQLSANEKYKSPECTLALAQSFGDGDPNCVARQNLLVKNLLLPQVMKLIEADKWISPNVEGVLMLLVDHPMAWELKKDWFAMAAAKGIDLNTPLSSENNQHISQYICTNHIHRKLTLEDIEFLMDLGMALPNDGADLAPQNKRQAECPTRRAFLAVHQSRALALAVPEPSGAAKVKKM